MNIIITGGTKGIGLAIAHAFANEGFDLAICSRSEPDLEELKNTFALAYPGIRILTRQTDMSKKEEVIAFADFIKNKWDKVDVLVNNAGVFLQGEIHKEEDGVLESQIETNLYSAYYLTRALLPVMLPHQKGHIFNMCSVASITAFTDGASYCISKFALLGFSKVLREEMKDKGIKVTNILPGATWTNAWAGAGLPPERLMQADDIANAVMSAWKMSPATVVEDIIMRPQLGDL